MFDSVAMLIDPLAAGCCETRSDTVRDSWLSLRLAMTKRVTSMTPT